MTESLKETEINLPREDKNVFIQLTATKGTLPDVPFVNFLFEPDATTDAKKIPEQGDAQLDQRYDLGATANALIGFKVLCEGAVLFKEKDTVVLKCEFFVPDDTKLPDSAEETVTGNAGETKSFQIRCKFV